MLRWLRSKVAPAASDVRESAPKAAAAVDRPLSTPPTPPAPPPEPVGPLALYRSRRATEAALACAQAFETDPDDIEAHWVTALLALDRGQVLEALRGLERAVAVAPTHLGLHVARGRALAAAGRRAEAASVFQRAAESHPRSGEPLVQLALLSLAARREDEAVQQLSAALKIEPTLAQAHVELANLQRSRGRVDEAVDHYQRALASQPDHVDALNNLGSLMRERGRLAEAAQRLERARQLRPDLAVVAYNLGLVRVDQRRWAEAYGLLREFADTHPKDDDAQYWLGNAAMALGHVFEARKAYQAALRLHAGFLQARWGVAMSQLPAVPQSAAEQDAAVESFRRELAKMKTWFRANPGAEGQHAVGAQQPFYLAYIPRNHRATLADYGALCNSLMSAWARRIGVPKPAPAGGAKCRVGIVSAHLHSHSVWHAIVRGWVEHLDPAKFELHLFHTGGARDAETEWAARRTARLSQGLGDWTTWAKTISDTRLDVLIYPEIGMDSTTTRLAALRLAPVQLASWGHPITTGLPTIDGYLSAEALEPDGAAAHYSEKLIRLPRLGCCYRPFGSQATLPDLAALGISPADKVLLCAGTSFKYAPKDDALLVEIARRCAPCKLVFFRAEPVSLSELLETRLRKAFEAAGVAFDDAVRFIPWQSQSAFFGLLDRADVFLDSVGFSGFNTAMQAIERGTPIVAWEGEFMRGRFASAILREAGLDEWVADTSDGYVERVARLCSEPGLRDRVKRQIAQARATLFDDRAAVAALGEQLVALSAGAAAA